MHMRVNGVLRHKLLNNFFASCALVNFAFSVPHIPHFDNSILPLLVFETLGFQFFTFLYTLNIM